jgi:NAD(P)-dependent dehydrogenase (short-subunit alcohol dehydrogenase family)
MTATSPTSNHDKPVALIVGGGPGISASCARLFSAKGLQVAIAARDPDKPAMQKLAEDCGVRRYACNAADPAAVAALFDAVVRDLGIPRLVIHNIDGRSPDIFRKPIADADSALVQDVLVNSAYSAFLVGQQAARCLLREAPDRTGRRGTIVFTNASAALKGYPQSAAFAMACHAKAGLTQSMARELMPQGIHVAHVPIDGAVGWVREDGSRQHRLAGTDENDNLLHPDHIAEMYWVLHQQHRSTWSVELVLRPWVEKW